jgi:Zn ribbon nucleic-acid-binding protein
MARRNIYKVSKKDSIETAIEKNLSLIDKIDKLMRENKKLRSENRTLKNAWQKTEEYLVAISEEKDIDEIFNEIDTKTNLRKIRKSCPNSGCSSKTMNKRKFDGYSIVSCVKCGYRNRVDERGTEET